MEGKNHFLLGIKIFSCFKIVRIIRKGVKVDVSDNIAKLVIF